MADQIGVSGLTELKDVLERKLPLALQGKASQRALAKAARPIVRDAQQRAPSRKPRGFMGPMPEDTDNAAGTLKRSIYSYRNRSSTRTYESRFIGVRGRAFYWHWIEFGRGTISKAKSMGTVVKGFFGKEVKAVPARPFMRPAFESKKMEALEIYRQTLVPEVEKVAAQHRAKTIRRITKSITGF
jgi:HK97 gp10 family phage protein